MIMVPHRCDVEPFCRGSLVRCHFLQIWSVVVGGWVLDDLAERGKSERIKVCGVDET